LRRRCSRCSFILRRCVPRIWKGAGRRGIYADASKRSGTIHIDGIEAPGTFVQVLQAVEKDDVTVRSVRNQGGYYSINYSQPIAAYIPAVLLKIAGEKVFLRCGP
jgi:hypothetical protein